MCVYLHIHVFNAPNTYKFNDLLHDEKFIIDSEIQTDLGAMSIKCILCEGKA
jgi:hypothetical protein